MAAREERVRMKGAREMRPRSAEPHIPRKIVKKTTPEAEVPSVRIVESERIADMLRVLDKHKDALLAQWKGNGGLQRLLAVSLRSRLSAALKRYKLKGIQSKTELALELVGCSMDELCQHLERQFAAGMDWSNYGAWHIDHIVPCASFFLKEEAEMRKCFHFTNLQPLWAADNSSKGARLDWVKP